MPPGLETGAPGTEPVVAPGAASPRRPIPPGERLPALDALRGLALLGVAAVNVPIMLGPEARFFALPWSEAPAPWALAATHLLFAGKSYALLAFLFGAGLAMQTRRLGAAAERILPRRLAALAAIGVAHGFLVWYGDILAVYGTVGVAWWLFFRDADEGAVRRWAVGLLATVPVFILAAWAITRLAVVVAPDLTSEAHEAALRRAGEHLARAIRVYGSGSFGDILAVRARAFLSSYLATLSYVPELLGLALAGGWAAARGLLDRPGEHRPLLARLAAAGICAGLPGELVYGALQSRGHGDRGAAMLAQAVHTASAPALALGGAAALLLLWSRGRARPLLLLAPLGRLSLSAYLAQSVAFTTIAYAYGAGLYGRLGPDAALALALACWGVQAVLAPLYLSRLRLGPAEWAWHTIAYR